MKHPRTPLLSKIWAGIKTFFMAFTGAAILDFIVVFGIFIALNADNAFRDAVFSAVGCGIGTGLVNGIIWEPEHEKHHPVPWSPGACEGKQRSLASSGNVYFRGRCRSYPMLVGRHLGEHPPIGQIEFGSLGYYPNLLYRQVCGWQTKEMI
jgi:hypothetical protein